LLEDLGIINLTDIDWEIEYFTFAGGLFGVEKAKPDPLNLLVNTNVGSK